MNLNSKDLEKKLDSKNLRRTQIIIVSLDIFALFLYFGAFALLWENSITGKLWRAKKSSLSFFYRSSYRNPCSSHFFNTFTK